MAAMYFVSYALIATLGGLIAGWAMYARKKSEGAPVNLTVLKAISALAIALWIGAGVTTFAVESDSQTLDTYVLVGSVIGALGVAAFAWQMVQVVHQMEADRKALRDLAQRDALTNSWNRRLFQENLDTEIERVKKSGQALTLVMFDIDDFHDVNEQYGYRIGDGILRELVHRIAVHVGSALNIYRYGGEEIALILPGVTASQAEAMADELTGAITKEPYDVGDKGPISIAVSIGVAPYEPNIHDEEELIGNALAALKISKAEVGDYVTVAGKDF